MTPVFPVLEKSVSEFVCWKIAVLVLLLVRSRCQTPSIAGPTSGVLGSSLQLICKLNISSDTEVLPFYRKGLTGTQCSFNIKQCLQLRAEEGYSCGCMSGQNEFYLNISSLKKQDDGKWRCSYNGVNSNNISLSVFYAPNISSSFPNHKDVTENSRPNIDCSSGLTVGKPADTNYTWTGPGNYSKSGSVLDRKVIRSQEGSYTCTARNCAGLSDSAQVNINVQYAPNISSSFPDNKDVTENSSPNIDCSSGLKDGDPSDSSYTWTGPGNYSKSGSVLDRRVSRSQGGSYTCTANNSAGLSDSAQVNINVQYAPDISLSPVEGKQNTDVTLTCTATGNPSNYKFEDFRQYWGDQLIQRREGTQTGDRYSLHLPRVSYCDSGVYVCNVSNDVKQPSHKNTTVTIEASPVYTNDTDLKQPVGAEVGQNVTLDQYVYCSPNFTSVSWHFNTTNTSSTRLSKNSSSVSSSLVNLNVYGTQVEVAGFKLVYTITNFQQEHVGLYTVSICNSEGCTESSLKLIGSGPPETPLHFKALNSTAYSVTLTWTPQYSGGDYTQEFHVEFRVQNTSGDWSSRVFPLSQDNPGAGVVDGLGPNTGYVFRIKSVTDRKIGNNQSPVSEEIYSSTKEPNVPPGPAMPIGAIAGGIVGGLACFILVPVLLLFLKRRKQNKGGHRERLRSNGRNGEIVMSDIHGAEIRATENAGVIYAEVKKKKKPVTDVYTEVSKPNRRQKKKDDVYENAVPRQNGDDVNTYTNIGFEGNEPEAKNENPQPPTGPDADGCLYVGIDFGNKKPGKVIIGKEKGSYVDIAFGKVGPPPPPDEDEEDDQKKK